METILALISILSTITALTLFYGLHRQTVRADAAEAALARVEAEIRDTEAFYETVLAIKDSGVQ